MDQATPRQDIFDKLKAKFGTHKAAARALGVGYRQYFHLRKNGLCAESTASLLSSALRQAGIEASPEDLINGDVDKRKLKKAANE